MNTGQMMLGIAALGLFTLIILNFNKGVTNTQDTMMYSKGFISASTIALSMLDEISGKAYDEVIVNGGTITTSSDFSPTLSAESGETYPNFDDVDDYNNFTKIDSVSQLGNFIINVKVEYITDGLIKTTARTFNKNVTVKVTSPTMINQTTGKVDTVVISSILSQWAML